MAELESVKDQDMSEKKNEKQALLQKIVLKNLNLEIEEGSLTVIVGEIGSGKTSLLSAMLGQLLYLPEEELKNNPIFD